MSTLFATAMEMQQRLGHVPLERIRMNPPPGTAGEKDVLRLLGEEGRICELVDGVLVEKAMGYYESRVAAALIYFIERFLEDHDLGIVLAPDGLLQILPGRVRAPDVSFLAWKRFPGRKLPWEPIPEIVPDLAIEVLSEGNTEEEMRRKISEYFEGGAKYVWLIEPENRTARCHRSETDFDEIGEEGTLEGGDVLPGFRLSLEVLFRRAGTRRS